MQWTLTINPKAVFSDGSPITAEDIKGTWDPLRHAEHQAPARRPVPLAGSKGSRTTSGAKKAMSGIVVKDATTVVVTP